MKVLFANGFLIDGAGGYLERGGLLVEDQRIAAVGKEVSDRLGDADAVIDLEGRTLMPGMIDTHCHPGAGDYDPDREKDSVGLAALHTYEALERTLRAGFTTVRSAGARDYVDVDARDAIACGIIPGPRVIASGRGVTMTGGHGVGSAAEVDGVDAVRREARVQIKRGADSIKIFGISGGVASGTNEDAEQFTVEEIRAAVEESRKAGKLNQTHAIGLPGIKNAVEAGVNSIDHGIFLDEEVCEKMARRGIFLVPTFGPFYYYAVRRVAEPWRWQRALRLMEPHKASFRLAMEKKVPIAFGCDCGAPSRFKNGENALEYQLMVEAGMGSMDAIVAGARNAARLLRLDHLIGTLEPGKLADIVVIERNPLEDITLLQSRVAMVMREGRVYLNKLGA
ncbi:MAG: amidohydrolase family protein [Chloroflexi bacterium]|nr:amidohydrolase family protein [Chloroflexota bacterium]